MTIQEFENLETTVCHYKQIRHEKGEIEKGLKTLDEMEGRDPQIHFSGITTWFYLGRNIAEECKSEIRRIMRKRIAAIELEMSKMVAPKTTDLRPEG